ncbi:hypothetical protein BGW80DRAFT_1366592, partial [Lactifluus volemus]
MKKKGVPSSRSHVAVSLIVTSAYSSPLLARSMREQKLRYLSAPDLAGANLAQWFRVYRDFFLPSESYDLIFL